MHRTSSEAAPRATSTNALRPARIASLRIKWLPSSAPVPISATTALPSACAARTSACSPRHHS
eukprot:4092441-Pyramimonas_sp.AAC.1